MRLALNVVRAATLPLAMVVAVACGRADAAASATPPSVAAPTVAPRAATPAVVGAAANVVPGTTASPLTAKTPARDTTDSVLIAVADRGRLMGRDSGAIWLVVMSDFQCPYCKSWHDSSMTQLTHDYVETGKVRLAYLNLPLQMHAHARGEAEASMCAAAQGKFWPFAAALFRDQKKVGALSDATAYLDGVAREMSLDMPTFGHCRQSKGVRALVESDIQQASRMGVRSTPSFLIGEFLVEGAMPYAYFRRAIDSALVMARTKRPR